MNSSRFLLWWDRVIAMTVKELKQLFRAAPKGLSVGQGNLQQRHKERLVLYWVT